MMECLIVCGAAPRSSTVKAEIQRSVRLRPPCDIAALTRKPNGGMGLRARLVAILGASKQVTR